MNYSMEQTKFERIMRIVILLTNQRLSVKQIAYKLEISQRSVYRYVDTLLGVGFIIEKKKNRYSIDKSSPFFKDIGFNTVG